MIQTSHLIEAAPPVSGLYACKSQDAVSAGKFASVADAQACT